MQHCYDTPQAVDGVSTAIQLSTDYDGFCAVLTTGSASCWGDNEYAQLGNGTIGGPVFSGYGYDTPQSVMGIDNARAMPSGDLGNCAVLTSGSAACWGDNSYGELGNGTVGGPDSRGGYDTAQPVVAAS